MIKKWTAGSLLAALCLLLFLAPALAETRQGVIVLEGQEESIEETLFESPLGFSFWYASDRLEVHEGEADGVESVIVGALYSDDYMALSLLPEDAGEYTGDFRALTETVRAQKDVSLKLEKGTYHFLTLIAENGQCLRASGAYSQEAAEGNAVFFQRVLDSVAFTSGYDAELLRTLPGQWAIEYEGAGTVLTLEESGAMGLSCYGTDGGFAYTCEGSWTCEPTANYSVRLTLLFTSTDNPVYAGSAYSVECVYEAYTEDWVENDTLMTCLILTPISGSGVSPFEEVYGDGGAALYRAQGPNMRVVKCKEFVSLREARSTSSARLAKVPLGALVLAFPEAGEENGFILCVYHDEYGYILSEYLQPAE